MSFRMKDLLLGVLIRPLIASRFIRATLEDLGESMSFHSLLRQTYPGYKFCGDRERLVRLALSRSREKINIFEFGVAQGLMTRFLCKQQVRPEFQYFGFDTFEGLPDFWIRGGVTYRPKGYFDSNGEVPELFDKRVTFVKGRIEDNLNLIGSSISDECSFFMFDLDLFEPTKLVFEYLSDKLKSGDILYFDEAFDSFGERRVIIDYVIPNPRFEIIGASNIAIAFRYV